MTELDRLYVLYRRAEGGDADALERLYLTARDLLKEKQRLSAKQGRPVDIKLRSRIQLYLLQAVREQVRKDGGVTRPHDLVGRIMALANRDGEKLAERTVRKVVNKWRPIIEQQVIRETGE